MSAYDLVTRNSCARATARLCARCQAIVRRRDEFALSEDIAERVTDACGDDLTSTRRRADRIESRLDAIAKLKRKYGADIGGILEFR